MLRNDLPGQWGNRTFPGPWENRTTCALLRKQPSRFPTYQRSDPRNENAMKAVNCGNQQE
jgi:hypothetical protein